MSQELIIGIMKTFYRAVTDLMKRATWKRQCIETQKALKRLHHAVVKSRSANDPLGMKSAMDEAGRWF